MHLGVLSCTMFPQARSARWQAISASEPIRANIEGSGFRTHPPDEALIPKSPRPCLSHYGSIPCRVRSGCGRHSLQCAPPKQKMGIMRCRGSSAHWRLGNIDQPACSHLTGCPTTRAGSSANSLATVRKMDHNCVCRVQNSSS